MSRSIALLCAAYLVQLPGAACAQVARETPIRDWIIARIESAAHPQRSLRVQSLTYSDVWASLPGTLAHREKNTVRVPDDATGTATFLVFDRSQPSFDLDRVNFQPRASDELNSVLLRIVRENASHVLKRAELIQRFDPTVALGAGMCVAEASHVARYEDSAAVGWRCAAHGETLQVDVFPSCAAGQGREKCLLVQVAANWPEAARR